MTEWCVWSQNPLIQKTARGDWGAPSALPSDLPAAARDCGAWGVSATLLSLGGIDALNNSDTVFVADFLRELFGNIARYADSTQRYVVLVSAAQDHVTIDVTDRPRQGGTTLEGRHSGLAYYRERVLHAHGDWDVREKRGQWVLHASVPVDNAG